jgi:hypothetical protein
MGTLHCGPVVANRALLQFFIFDWDFSASDNAGITVFPFQGSHPRRKRTFTEPDRRAQLMAMTQDRDKYRQQLSSLPKPLPYLNPLHDALVKWRIVSWIRGHIKAGLLSPSCHVVINRLQEPYSEDLAKEVKDILDGLGWIYEERFADSTVEKEVTIRGPQHGPGHDCADQFSYVVRDTTKTKNGNQFGGVSGYSDETPTYLKQCGPSCFGIDVGNEEPKTP